MSRPTRTERRRAQLALRIASLERMESRSLITESLGILLAGIGVPTALALVRPVEAGQAQGGKSRPSSVLDGATMPIVTVPASMQGSGGGGAAPTADGDSTTLPSAPVDSASSPSVFVPKANVITVASSSPSSPSKGGGAGGTSHGGSGSVSPAAVVSTASMAASSASSSTSGSSNAPPILPAAASSTATPSPTTVALPTSSSSTTSVGLLAAPVASPSSGSPTLAPVTSPPSTGGTTSFSPSYRTGFGEGVGGDQSDGGDAGVSGGGFAQDMMSFAHFPVYTLDENAGEVLYPGAAQLATLGGNVDLRAQVENTTVSSYSWDTSGLTDATDISGASTYDLTFQWDNSYVTATTNSVTLAVTNASSQTEVETYLFQIPQGSGTAGTGTATWPSSLSPDTVSASAPSVSAQNVSVDSNSGSLDTAITLPTYNPNVPAVVLSYDSETANPLPIITVPHTLDPTLATPSQVSAQLTFNGTSGSTYYYNTSGFTPGDVQQIALQAGSSLSTGRYAYSVSLGDIRGSTTTSSVSGNTTVINDSGSALGAGWSVDGLEKIIPATGGVILDLGSGGKSLWFATGSGSTYVDPAGEFSTLVANMGGTYTRTLTNGEKIQFNSSGQEIADVDTNNVAISYGYDGSGRLSTIEDHYGNTTTFTYDGSTNLLDEITDPTGRIATFTHSGTALSGVALPDSSTWGFGYNGSSELTHVTDPDSHAVTVVYDSANRVGTITNPDATSETFIAAQEQGFVPSGSGTSGSPATATLLAQATSTVIDPLGNETDLYPDWDGLGLTNVTSDPQGNISSANRDSNGLATIVIDNLNRTTQYVYDSKGNVTESIDPGLNASLYTYNSFSEVTSYTDPNSNTTTYTYDSYGNNTVIQDALHNLTTMTYTATGQLATSEDADHNTTSYAYDSQDRLTTITNADSSTTHYSYNNAGDETSTTDGRGYVTTMSYDPMNRLTGTTDALGDKVTYVYDAAGNETADREPLSRTTSYSYDAMNRVVTETDPLGGVTTFGYDADGNQTTVKDPLGRITTTTYDALNRPVTVTDPLSGTTTTDYDADGEKLDTIDPLSRETSYTYTVLGEVATITDPLNNVTTMNYDTDGNLSTELQSQIVNDAPTSYTYDADERVIAISDHLDRTTTTVYDAAGNVSATVDGAGDRTTYTYNSMNEVSAETDPLGNITTYTYDADGDQTTVKDPVGDLTTTAYDALDRVTTISQAVGGTTTFAYDAAGRQVGLTDPVGNRTTWTYDADDRITAEANPLGTTTYAYDADGEETATTDADGRQTTYSYDADGDQTGETWVGSSPSEVITYTYDADNEMTVAKDTFSLLTYTYDADGDQLTAATSSPGGQPEVTLTSTYNANQDRISLSDNLSSAGVISYGYDSMDQMTSITANFGSANTLFVTFGYDQAGRMTTIRRSSPSSGGGIVIGGGGASTEIDTNLSYDAESRVTTIIHDLTGGSVLETYTYDYNAASELTAETNAEGALSYTYDADSELTGVSGASTATYTYDNNGNRTMTGYTTGSDNELTAGAGYTYTYDNDGNLISETQTSTGDVTTYTYDYRNRLTGVVEENSSHSVIMQGTYTYDALNRRIGVDEKISFFETKTWTVYDGVNSYADFDGSGTLLERYLYGPRTNQILARTSASGTEAWYLADNEGTIRDIVSTSGSVLDHIAYDAYGNVTSESSPSNGDRFKFDGMAWDTAIGLYYDNARYYDTVEGRFISQDPMLFSSGDFNLYRYVLNSPTNAVDITVLQEQEVDNPKKYYNELPMPTTSGPRSTVTIPTVPENGPGKRRSVISLRLATLNSKLERLKTLRLNFFAQRRDFLDSGGLLTPEGPAILQIHDVFIKKTTDLINETNIAIDIITKTAMGPGVFL